MSDTVRRVVVALVALAIIAIAFAWGAMHEQTLVEAATVEAKANARALLANAARELAKLPEGVAAQAKSFADFDKLKPFISQTTSQDVAQLAATLKDADSEESWLGSWTGVGTVAVAFDGRVVFSSGDRPVPQAVEALIPRAQSQLVAELVSVNGAPVLAGLASSVRGAQQQPSVVLMFVPLDAARLAPVAQTLGATLSVVTATGELSSGNPSEAGQLKAFLSAGGPEGNPCCAVQPLVGELKLGVYVDPQPSLLAAQAAASRDRVASGIVGGLLGALVLVLGLRRARVGDEHHALLRETAAELQKSREERQLLSQRISTGGSTLPGAPPHVTDDGGLGQTASAIQRSRYDVVAPLGEGGMARVSVAQVLGAEGFRRLFVVKRLRPELAGNQELVNQFIDEARLGSSLVHSNIVPVFDFGRDAEGYYIAQEYILGRDVDAVVHASKQKRGMALESSIVLYIAQEALKALSYAHTPHDTNSGRPLGLVHRDVSPNNLMLSARGELKLLDFGIVKSDQRLTRTQTGVVKGNLYFMSPEQARAENVDARSDLFSLGLVLFTAATGDTLYSGNTSYELLTRAGAGPTPEDLARLSSLPSGLAELIRRALQPLPHDRFFNADEFSRAVAENGGIASSTEVQGLMERLFKDEFALESSRISRPAP